MAKPAGAGNPANPRQPIIRASEVGEYVYCRRAWWFKNVANVAAPDDGRFARGTAAHAQHGEEVAGYERSSVVARVLLLLAALLIVIGGITLIVLH